MKYIGHVFALSAIAFLSPTLALAQTTGDPEFRGEVVGNYLSGIVDFINEFVIPFIFAIAFIIFIWGVFQYFIAGGANEEQRDKGKQFVMWGLAGFFIMLTLWGIVNLLVATTGLDEENEVTLPTFDPFKK